jgi:hypothetical protein
VLHHEWMQIAVCGPQVRNVKDAHLWCRERITAGWCRLTSGREAPWVRGGVRLTEPHTYGISKQACALIRLCGGVNDPRWVRCFLSSREFVSSCICRCSNFFATGTCKTVRCRHRRHTDWRMWRSRAALRCPADNCQLRIAVAARLSAAGAGDQEGRTVQRG